MSGAGGSFYNQRRGGSINSGHDMGSFVRQVTGGSMSGQLFQEPIKESRMSSFHENAEEAKDPFANMEIPDDIDRAASNADALRMTAKSDVFSYQSPKEGQ